MNGFATVIILFIIEHIFTAGMVVFFIWDRRLTRIHIAKLQAEMFEEYREKRQNQEPTR